MISIVKHIPNTLDQDQYFYLKPQLSGDWLVFAAFPLVFPTRKTEQAFPSLYLSQMSQQNPMNRKGGNVKLIRLNPAQTAAVLAALDQVEAVRKIRKAFPNFDEAVTVPITLQKVATFLAATRRPRYLKINRN